MPLNSASRRCAVFAGVLVVALAAFSFASSSFAQQDRRSGGTWTAAGTGDCTGRDWGQSEGALPQGARCLANTNGQIAVCWDGIKHKHPARAGAWCTYKNVTANQCIGGSNTGVVYTCAAPAATAPPPPQAVQPAPGRAAWLPRGFGDCTAGDWASSEGPQVDPARCTPQTAGGIAVCWDGQAMRNPSRAGAWCTYKNTPFERCTGGSNEGYIYQCRTDIALAPPSPGVTPPAPPPAVTPPLAPPPPTPQANSKLFPVPMYGKYSVSNCLDFGGVGCGQPAADAFCKKEGFTRASGFKVGYGAPMSFVPGPGKPCDDPGCARLENVTCVRP